MCIFVCEFIDSICIFCVFLFALCVCVYYYDNCPTIFIYCVQFVLRVINKNHRKHI